MRTSFIIVFFVILFSTVGVYWRTLKIPSSKVLFIVLALANVTLYMMYAYKQALTFPTDWVVNQLVPLMNGILKG
ncbi:hypothetical protein [Paenibacillus sp. y28]|uniref:hypothetical protein n=1 Tax=Paenibacillus sp. y28 TaxID=3129110 RepID=UPI003018D338